ncbi:hypothetical protein SCHPADRAFT_475775 [Schizopora paradoxa]|uniref:F-box domain-containing protein n=1 Tax=Schizopora paradoxa TaxID=27342 RepID=A0A0H2S2Z4_9AGAM|nr:hypothetical protein SCHPADRAFT_475775 [Schizopora paradoxa]
MPTDEGVDMLSNHTLLPLTMITPTFEGLPEDVRVHLLCMLPDVEALKAAVLSCKAFHEAYKPRKKSIDNEVPYDWLVFELRILLQRICKLEDTFRRAGV